VAGIASFRFSDLSEGQEFAFDVAIRAEDIDTYARVSGDVSPLHMDAAFAKQRGFRGRVAHGGLLGAYISRMVGVHCPGQNALLQALDLKFLKPFYEGDTAHVTAQVDMLSAATQVMVLKVQITDASTGQVHVRGKAQVGFTRSIGE